MASFSAEAWGGTQTAEKSYLYKHIEVASPTRSFVKKGTRASSAAHHSGSGGGEEYDWALYEQPHGPPSDSRTDARPFRALLGRDHASSRVQPPFPAPEQGCSERYKSERVSGEELVSGREPASRPVSPTEASERVRHFTGMHPAGKQRVATVSVPPGISQSCKRSTRTFTFRSSAKKPMEAVSLEGNQRIAGSLDGHPSKPTVNGEGGMEGVAEEGYSGKHSCDEVAKNELRNALPGETRSSQTHPEIDLKHWPKSRNVRSFESPDKKNGSALAQADGIKLCSRVAAEEKFCGTYYGRHGSQKREQGHGDDAGQEGAIHTDLVRAADSDLPPGFQVKALQDGMQPHLGVKESQGEDSEEDGQILSDPEAGKSGKKPVGTADSMKKQISGATLRRHQGSLDQNAKFESGQQANEPVLSQTSKQMSSEPPIRAPQVNEMPESGDRTEPPCRSSIEHDTSQGKEERILSAEKGIQGKHWVTARLEEYQRKEEEVTGVKLEQWEEEEKRWRRMKATGNHSDIREWPIGCNGGAPPAVGERADASLRHRHARVQLEPSTEHGSEVEMASLSDQLGKAGSERKCTRYNAERGMGPWRRQQRSRTPERRRDRSASRGQSSERTSGDAEGKGGSKPSKLDEDSARGAAAAEAAAAAATKLAAATAAAARVSRAVQGVSIPIAPLSSASFPVGAAVPALESTTSGSSTQATLDSNAAGVLSADQHQVSGGRKRKSRWGDSSVAAGPGLSPISTAAARTAVILSNIRLPQFVKELTGGVINPEIQALNACLNELNHKLQNGLFSEGAEGDRSPSPEPVYNNTGVRVNTREARAKDKLLKQRQQVISQLIKKNPEYKPPADYRPPKLYKKLYIPLREYPGYNFIGLIIGPRGNTQKRMEKETGAKIVIRGKGSQKEGRSGGAPLRDFKHLEPADHDELHVLIEADSEASLEQAAEMVQKLLMPVDEGHNEHKRQQLRELATINGTAREIDLCHLCGEPGHRQYDCPEKSVIFRAEVTCKICGDGGHPTRDCPVGGVASGKSKPPMDEEYRSFLAEVGGGPGPEDPAAGASGLRSCEGQQGHCEGGPLSRRPGFGLAEGTGGGRPPFRAQRDDECNLYVGQLPFSVADQALYELFAPFGEIVEAKTIRDRSTGLSRGFGFVRFAEKEAALSATKSLHGYCVEGRSIVVRSTQKGQHQHQHQQQQQERQPQQDQASRVGGLQGPGVYRGPLPVAAMPPQPSPAPAYAQLQDQIPSWPVVGTAGYTGDYDNTLARGDTAAVPAPYIYPGSEGPGYSYGPQYMGTGLPHAVLPPLGAAEAEAPPGLEDEPPPGTEGAPDAGEAASASMPGIPGTHGVYGTTPDGLPVYQEYRANGAMAYAEPTPQDILPTILWANSESGAAASGGAAAAPDCQTSLDAEYESFLIDMES